jgi:hypothetical protein
MINIDALVRSIEALPPDEGTAFALRFLARTDLTESPRSEAEVRYTPAEEWLSIYKIKRWTSDKAGMKTYGFPSLLSALERLPPSEPISIRCFQCAEWYGTFWLNKSSELVGFVLVERRTPAEEQKRLDYFRRNMT